MQEQQKSTSSRLKTQKSTPHLLITNPQSGEYPHHPPEKRCNRWILKLFENQPRIVRTGDEDINHRAIKSMQEILECHISLLKRHIMVAERDAEQENERRSINNADEFLLTRVRL